LIASAQVGQTARRMSKNPSVAYFCMEFGLSPELPIYSGGLGVLAGDHMKSVGDLSMPLVGIGLLWAEGYVEQHIGASGAPVDRWRKTPRDALKPLAVEVEVVVAGKVVRLAAYQVQRYLRGKLYLLEPIDADDQWITKRLYGGTDEDRIAQEIVLGVGGVRLLRALGISPDVYHFNEGHAVFAGLELVRERMQRAEPFEEAVAAVRKHVVFTTHTPVKAGNEIHDVALLRRQGADLGFGDAELAAIGSTPFGMTVAGLRLARKANAVAALHGDTARAMWKDVEGAAPIINITNGVHVPTWQDARIRAALVPDKPEEVRRRELWDSHQDMKRELLDELARRGGPRLDGDCLLVGFARRAASYKRADLIFGDPERLEKLFEGRRLQLVFAGKAHPADHEGKAMVARVVAAARRWPNNVVFAENYEMTLGALLTRGCDVWLNNPRRPKEASGTSGMKAAMNGVLNLSILDGWWPEGCEHGVTGWRFGGPLNDKVDLAADATRQLDDADRDSLYDTLADQVMARYYGDRDAWVGMMMNSVAMSSWRFSSDRMVEDYFRELYRVS
jgi:starch phosphorylase